VADRLSQIASLLASQCPRITPTCAARRAAFSDQPRPDHKRVLHADRFRQTVLQHLHLLQFAVEVEFQSSALLPPS